MCKEQIQHSYKNTGAIHTDPENDHYLYDIQKSKGKEVIFMPKEQTSNNKRDKTNA